MVTGISKTDDFPLSPIHSIKSTQAVASSSHALQRQLSLIPLDSIVHAKLVSRLQDKTFLVTIDQIPLTITLSENVEVGDQLLLRVLEHSPRLTFQLIVNNFSPTQTEEVHISSAAQQLEKILSTQDTQTPVVLKTALTNPAQLLENPSLLAQALHKLFAQSGLFYESHVQKWSSKKYAFEPLQQESQALSLLSPKEQEQRLQQQLSVLEHNQLIWEGQLTDQFKVRWEINQQSHPNPQQAFKEEPKHWYSVLDCQLKTLGKISLQIHWYDAQKDEAKASLRILCSASDPNTVERLKQQQQKLLDALYALPINTQIQIMQAE